MWALVTHITQTTTQALPALALRAILTEPAAAAIWLLSAAVCVALAMVFDPMMLTTDTAQHVSVARNIVAGHGLVTDLLYFEQQQVFGTMPAPQTVWPPLFPLLTALLLSLGVNEQWAVFWLSLGAHLLIAPAVYAIVRVAGYRARAAACAALACLLFAFNSMLVLGGLTESLFTLCTLLACLAWMMADVRTGGARTAALLLAGAFAALAYLTRYSGLCLVFALAAIAGLRWLRAPTWPRLRDALLVAALPVTVVLATLVRNYLLTGSASGGPSVEVELSVMATLRTFYWSVAKLFGFDADSAWRHFVVTALAVLIGIALGRIWVALADLRTPRSAPADPAADRARRAGLTLALTYAGLSLLLIGALAVTRYPEFVNDRYLAPLWPFAVLTFAFVMPSRTPWAGVYGRRVAAPVLAFLTLVLLAGQSSVVDREMGWFHDDPRIPTIRAALAEELATPVDGAGTVAALLAHSSAQAPLMATNGQYLGLLLRRPVVGLGETRFTSKQWDEAAVRELARRFNVKYFVFFPTLFFPTAIENRNRVFSAELHRGSVPPWLAPVHRSARVQVYQITHE